MIKSIIVAKTENNVIGKDNQLLWHMPKDMQYFKRTTMGHHVIMGRKTFASVKKPLPGRNLIIVTHNTNYRATGCSIVHSMQAALTRVAHTGDTEVFIAGGGEIYQTALPLADKIYLTEIKTKLVGDTFFPPIDQDTWKEIKRVHHPADTQHAYAYDFVELINKYTYE